MINVIISRCSSCLAGKESYSYNEDPTSAWRSGGQKKLSCINSDQILHGGTQ